MSFQQGLSGLAGATKNLDVIGNNIANVATAGFKQSRAEFADVYASSLYGAGGIQVGIGTQVLNVAQQFTQGNISLTNNPLDVAINGDGFFRLNDRGAVTYSRNGQFHLDKDGYLITNTGLNVMGYTDLTLDVNNNVIGAANLGNIQIDLNDLQPQATSSMDLVLNLDAGVSLKTIAGFDPNTASTYNFSSTFTIYDSLGVDHQLTLYYLNTADTATTSTWSVYAYVNGSQLDLGAAGAPVYHDLVFDNTGTLTPATATTSNQPFAVAPAQDLAIAFDFTGTTQYAGDSGVTAVSQDGYARGRVIGVTIDENGIVNGRYTNGLTRPLQQLVLANFRNPNALVPLGNNQWAAISETGSEVLNTPGVGIAGAVQAGATEDANVDLTGELVNLIVAQRLYQANAQTIRAQDQILQTLVNLR
ncbi:flagellar hook protein FlgE [Sulfuritortus calidifontis]|uniref:Flagellar hook protein FlgE n=1 Tax=Sulfuritortus calidifontis TaxID=1914471 RepID=A0A4R3JUL5_9PROT|nr:flagellar hook protein FlgE [Sulfuritortus calidifontis]TCS71517.1 flagellar hook protein FlgE [Sulfuritortus calidifontis]